MKTIKILFLCIIASIFVNAQNVHMHTLTEVEVNPPKFAGKTIVEQMPKPSIGKYFATNFEYPEVIGLVHEGIEVIQFNVNPSGKLDGFKVINSVSPQVDEEVIRVLKTTNHMWLPGHNNGTPVAMEHEIAIQVKCIDLDGSASKKDFTEFATNFYNKGTQKLFIEGKTNKALKSKESFFKISS